MSSIERQGIFAAWDSTRHRPSDDKFCYKLLERNRLILRDYYKLTDKHLTSYSVHGMLMAKYKLSSKQIRTILNKMRMKQ